MDLDLGVDSDPRWIHIHVISIMDLLWVIPAPDSDLAKMESKHP